ncbi:MAG: hypothetical protein ACMXX9_04100 [Candidatus Woesearchaeota archaeon]
MYELVDYSKGDYLVITQGLNEIMIMSDEKFLKDIKNIFSKQEIKYEIKSLSSLTINIPLESIETVGLFYLVTKTLNWNNINIVEIVSTLTKMTFIIKEKDVSLAFESLNKLIRDHL